MNFLTEKILVGIDDSNESWKALQYAINEAKQKEVEGITVVHSKERGKQARSGKGILKEAKEFGKEEGISVVTQLLTEAYDPDVNIVKFAEENYFNHIIVGSKGRSGIQRILLGSVAEGIVEKAHCPVTVFRGKYPL